MDKTQNRNIKYYAFISYKHMDNAPWAKSDHLWAKSIHKHLTACKIPKGIDKLERIKSTDKRISPVFRDADESHSGKDVSAILQDNLRQSRALIVICSSKMIVEQEQKSKLHEERAYIYEEIDYFRNNCEGPIIPVWIDKKPFDKKLPECLPAALRGSDLKVVDVNAYRKHRCSIKHRITAEIAASIFQTNKSLFWDSYKVSRRNRSFIIAATFLFFLTIAFFLHREANINKAYKNIAQANEYLTQGNRYEAMKLTKEAYESNKNSEGLSTLMRNCLDKSIPFMVYDSPIDMSADGSIYAIIKDDHSVEIYDAKTNEVLKILNTKHVENIKISDDNRLIGCVSSKDSVRIFDMENNKQVFSIKTKSGDNFNEIIFNKSGTKIYVYNNSYPGGCIYDLNNSSQHPFYPFSTFSDKSSEQWRSGQCSFMANDSLVVVYGKASSLSDERGWLSEDRSMDKWVCYIYNLHKQNSVKSIIYQKVSVPENTTNIAVSKFGKIIITTTDNVIVLNYDHPQSYTITLDYPYMIGGGIVGYDKIYKEVHPDWNKIHVKNIMFSPNAQYALLISSNNIHYKLRLSDYPRFLLTSNSLYIDKDPRYFNEESFNKDDIALGITNDGDVIKYDPNVQGACNIYIEGRHIVDRLHKPSSSRNTKSLAYDNDEQFFILDKYRSPKSHNITTYIYKSYVYRKTDRKIKYDPLDRFKENNDTIIVAISPTKKYAILTNPNLSNFWLWDNRDNKIIFSFSDILSSGSDFITGFDTFISDDDEVVGLFSSVMSDNKVAKTYFVFDIANKSVDLKRRVNEFYNDIFVLGNNLLAFNTEDKGMQIYDVKRKMNIRQFGEKYYFGSDWNKSVRLLEKREMISESSWHKYNIYLYNIKENQLIEIPDSLHHGCHINSNDDYISLSHYNTNKILIFKLPYFKLVYTLPFEEYNARNEFIFFTQDGKYIIYKKNEYSDLTVFDLERGRELYTFNGYIDIHSRNDLNKLTFRGFACLGKYMAIYSNKLLIMDIGTGKRLTEFDLPFDNTPLMQFTPNGRYLIADNYLIDMKTMKCIDSMIDENIVCLQDNCLIYRNNVCPIMSEKQLYEAIVEEINWH